MRIRVRNAFKFVTRDIRFAAHGDAASIVATVYCYSHNIIAFWLTLTELLQQPQRERQEKLLGRGEKSIHDISRIVIA